MAKQGLKLPKMPKNTVPKKLKDTVKALVDIARQHKAGVIKKKTLSADIDIAVKELVDEAYHYGREQGQAEVVHSMVEAALGR